MSLNALTKEGEDGFLDLAVPEYEYKPLDVETCQQRFLVLHPCAGDRNDESHHVRASIETVPLADAKPFVAVKNSRGYRLLQRAIEIDGKGLIVPVAVENFLRHFREEHEPVRLWIRHVCLVEQSSEEGQRYWNREFIDSMYQRATEVVDMTAFNQQLLDEGKILTSHDSRYGEWTKDWTGPPENFPLPRVFPIRVGQKTSMTDPTDRFPYVPLDPVTREIRVIVLHKTDNQADPVTLHLAHCPIKCEVAYQALSYTWGDEQPTTDIIVNGQLLAITKPLEQVLRNLRQRAKGEVILWIDAICIDQLNVAERNRHLPRIAQVYDTAASVISYLGELDDDADVALGLIPKLQEPMMRFDAMDNFIVGAPGEFSPEELARHCAALYRFLTRPYFHRVWVQQEIAWASAPVVLCGERLDFDLRRLEKAAQNLEDMLLRDPSLIEGIEAASPGLCPLPAELQYLRKIVYLRHIVSRGAATDLLLQTTSSIPSASPGFLETAIMARNFEASDPHDKLFALWNLAQDKEGLEFNMDYKDSVPDSFTKFAKAWATQHKSLDVIASAERNESSRDFYASAPSWAPDWSPVSTVSSMVRREAIPNRLMMTVPALDGALYSSDGGIKGEDFDEPLFSFDGNKLLCTGLVLDHLHCVMGNAPTPQQKLIMCVMGAYNYYTAMEQESPYEDNMQAAWAMCHGDVISSWPHRPSSDPDASPGSEDPQVRYKGDRASARHMYPYVTDISSSETLEVTGTVLKGRILGFTTKGYMCLLPHWVDATVENGKWLLAILAGCSTPVVLQEYEDGTFRVAGAAFVQGWMEGEVLAPMRGEKTLTEFWAEKLKEKKMCIL